jgi:hypothetical protein
MAGLQKAVAKVHRAGEFERTLEYRLRAGFGGVHRLSPFRWGQPLVALDYKGASGARKL